MKRSTGARRTYIVYVATASYILANLGWLCLVENFFRTEMLIKDAKNNRHLRKLYLQEATFFSKSTKRFIKSRLDQPCTRFPWKGRTEMKQAEIITAGGTRDHLNYKPLVCMDPILDFLDPVSSGTSDITPCGHWCRRRGCMGCKLTPKVLIC